MSAAAEMRPWNGAGRYRSHSLPRWTIPIRTTAVLPRYGLKRPNDFLRRGNYLPFSTSLSHRGSRLRCISFQWPGHPVADIRRCIGHKEIAETPPAADIAVPELFALGNSDCLLWPDIQIYVACRV